MGDALAWLASAPWLIAGVIIPLLLGRRWRISRFHPPKPGQAPRVSVIVPARNEAENISACLATLLNSEYPSFEVIVVDDQSTDGTPEIVSLIAERSGGRLRMLHGQTPPPGWIGKPWACWQGYQAATGDVLLFTDADTRHDEALLGHTVGALQSVEADLVSVLPRQRMLSFWERVVLPHLFTLITLRYHDVERVSFARNPRDVIANGQYMLFRRSTYKSIGGHEAVQAEVVEDLALAQHIVASGGSLLLAHADDLMDTRMYRSLGGIMEGWTKNLALGSARTVGGWLAPLVPWIVGAFTLAVWVLPFVLLVSSMFVHLPGAMIQWSVIVVSASALSWMATNLTMKAPPQHGLLYWLGALVVGLLFFRSALKGRTVDWRGRRYE